MDNTQGLALHHIGCVVDSIEQKIESYRLDLGALSVSRTFADPIQRAWVAFLELPTPGAAGRLRVEGNSSVQLELVQPMTPDSPVARFLENGGGLHHLCYEVDNLPEQIQRMKAQHSVLIRRPQPAVAFGGRHVAWMRSSGGILIEYLERSPSSG